MPNKAARRRQRREREERHAAAVAEEQWLRQVNHEHCVDAELGRIDDLVGHAMDALIEVEDAAKNIHRMWPVGPATTALHGLLDELLDVATVGRAKLQAVDARVDRVRKSDQHLHLVGTRVVRMVEVSDNPYPEQCANPNDDIPF